MWNGRASLDADGVTQPHAVDALRRLAALNRVARRFARPRSVTSALAGRIRNNFVNDVLERRSLRPSTSIPSAASSTRTDSPTSTGPPSRSASQRPAQQAALWPKLRDERRFRYGGMPTGIATLPETYEAWEFSYPDRMDLAAMGPRLVCGVPGASPDGRWRGARRIHAEGVPDRPRFRLLLAREVQPVRRVWRPKVLRVSRQPHPRGRAVSAGSRFRDRRHAAALARSAGGVRRAGVWSNAEVARPGARIPNPARAHDRRLFRARTTSARSSFTWRGDCPHPAAGVPDAPALHPPSA